MASRFSDLKSRPSLLIRAARSHVKAWPAESAVLVGEGRGRLLLSASLPSNVLCTPKSSRFQFFSTRRRSRSRTHSSMMFSRPMSPRTNYCSASTITVSLDERPSNPRMHAQCGTGTVHASPPYCPEHPGTVPRTGGSLLLHEVTDMGVLSKPTSKFERIHQTTPTSRQKNNSARLAFVPLPPTGSMQATIHSTECCARRLQDWLNGDDGVGAGRTRASSCW